MSILNAANMGKFSSDRTVPQYAEDLAGSTGTDVKSRPQPPSRPLGGCRAVGRGPSLPPTEDRGPHSHRGVRVVTEVPATPIIARVGDQPLVVAQGLHRDRSVSAS